MLQNNKDIQSINDSLEWVRLHRPNDYEQKFLQLVEQRRLLTRISNAARNNPGIAAFGKSQVGKSYLISCLLQDNGKPFKVKTAQGEYDFVFEINPPSEEGGGRESTGVVTRFTSHYRNPELYSLDCPVMVKTFSVADVIAILTDSYFNDFSNYVIPDLSDLEEVISNYRNKYGHLQPVRNPVLLADDMLNLKEYVQKHVNNAQGFVKASFFDRLATIIEKIPAEDYAGVFSMLWNSDANLTKLFNRLFNTLAGFDFAEYIYLPIGAVLHNGIKENTIMSVQCLKQLFSPETEFVTDVYLRNNGKLELRKKGFPKSDICAICSEVIFKIEEEFLNSSGTYCMDNVSPAVAAKIGHDEIKMSMLRTNDLLDFPGARAREQEDVKKISEESVLLNCYLRGKVAYLFNKYNSDKTINILLYCHHNKDNDVTSLYKLLQDWVLEYVGKTPKARKQKLEQTKVSPLFYIGTMFNLDMTLGVGAVKTEEAINQRWIGRFDTVMNKQCFHTDTVEWVNNWTDEGVAFQNSYVLRDYKFSGEKSGLYKGFKEHKREMEMMMSEEYYNTMRTSFIKNPFVKQLFKDPDVSWDVAASINNDGALYIMENLAEVAQRMDSSREHDFDSAIKEIREKVYKLMKDYYISTDSAELLEANIQKSKAIFREMDFTCNSDNYYFGHLLQAMQVTETSAYKVVHAVMQSPEINGKVNDFKDYEIIRNSCKKAGYPIEASSNHADKWSCVINTYGFSTQAEAEEFLSRKGIEVTKLFDGTYKRKLNSCIIGDAVFEKWASNIKSVEFLNEFSREDNFDSSIMTMLVDNIITTAKSLGLHDKMAEAIAEYVNVVNIHTANESLLADILASLINDFVLDLGFKYLSDEDKAKAEKVCASKGIPAFDYILKETKAVYEEEDITAMFNEMSENPQVLLPSFDDNYNKWLEYMFISFVAHLDVPEYDYQANQALSEILGKIKAVS